MNEITPHEAAEAIRTLELYKPDWQLTSLCKAVDLAIKAFHNIAPGWEMTYEYWEELGYALEVDDNNRNILVNSDDETVISVCIADQSCTVSAATITDEMSKGIDLIRRHIEVIDYCFI